jgi:hypothetical protein
MLNAQVARARVADRTDRADRAATNRQLLASSQPDQQTQRHRWRSRRTWNRAAGQAPVQA